MEIDKDQVIDWDKKWDQIKIAIKLYSIQPNIQLEEALNLKCLPTIIKESTHQIKNKPFDKGTFSYAYYCKDENNFPLIVKRPISQCKLKDYIKELQKNGLCTIFSEEFNKKLAENNLQNYQIFMISTFLALISEDSGFYLFEGYIPGKYEKIMNNWTYLNKNIDTRVFTAFSHFTWHASRGRYLVVDLQGVGQFLTDPVIHSLDLRFNKSGDFGLKGINMFFIKHKCNEICKKLNLVKHSRQDQYPLLNYIELDLPLNTNTKQQNQNKNKKKCKSRLCNLQTYLNYEWCQKCYNKFNQKQSLIFGTCEQCAGNFEYNQFYIKAMVIDEPTKHSYCNDP